MNVALFRRLPILLLLALLTAAAGGCGNKGELVRPSAPSRG
jgi:predicted small lipoprotein YifL